MQVVNAAPEAAGKSGQKTVEQPETMQLKRLLVYVDDALLRADQPEHAALLERAIWLSRGTGARIELFLVCDDEPLMRRWFRSERELIEERTAIVDRAATRLAELAADLRAGSGLEVDFDARWAEPRVAAVIDKALESRADLILAESSQSNYLVGLLSNTDWELVRRSPANIWFVNGNSTPPKRVLAALGSTASDDGSISRIDYDICELTRLLSAEMGTRTTVLQSADGPHLLLEAQQTAEVLAEYFLLKADSFNVVEGQASASIPEFAAESDSDVIVMGAATLSRLERLLKPVTAEPVLARATCDVVFIREHIDPQARPDTLRPSVPGLPAIDLERALTDPDIVFDHSPQKLVDETRLSIGMRRRLLQIWEADLKAELVQAEEGGTRTATGAVNRLPAVQRAMQVLDAAAGTNS